MPSAVRCEGIRIKEGRQDFITSVLGTWFCAVNQAYFTGLFLCISDYFVPGSYDRKGVGRFLKERLIRLGIPLAVFSWMINRLFLYGAQAVAGGVRRPLWFSKRCLFSHLCTCCGGCLPHRGRPYPPSSPTFPARAPSHSLRFGGGKDGSLSDGIHVV